MLRAFVAVSVLVASAAAASPLRVVVTTDIGTDFDDTHAVAYLASRPDLFKLELVVTSTRNVTGRAQLTAKFLEHIQRSDVPVGEGIGDDLCEDLQDCVGPQWPWAAGYDVGRYAGRYYKDGVSAAIDILATGTPQEPVWLLALAPANNIAEILARRPDLAAKTRVVAMSGSIYRGYNNVTQPAAEYNVQDNITASQAMYQATWARPMVVAPLDTSNFMAIRGEQWQRFLAAAAKGPSGNPLAYTLQENFKVWYDNGASSNEYLWPWGPSIASDDLWDLQAAVSIKLVADAEAAGLSDGQTAFLAGQSMRVLVDDQGFTRVTQDTKVPMCVEQLAWRYGAFNSSNALAELVVDSYVHPVRPAAPP